jgi:hypothetical protein
MHLQLNALGAQNKDYQKVILGLEERLQAVGIAHDAIQKNRNQLEV